MPPRDAVVLYLEQQMIGCRCLILGQSTAIDMDISRKFRYATSQSSVPFTFLCIFYLRDEKGQAIQPVLVSGPEF